MRDLLCRLGRLCLGRGRGFLGRARQDHEENERNERSYAAHDINPNSFNRELQYSQFFG